MINFDDILIEDFTSSDVVLLMDYYYDSPQEQLEKMSIDRFGMVSRELFSNSIIQKIENNSTLKESKLDYVKIIYKEKSIGTHSVTEITEGQSAVFHAHIWDKSMQGKGVGRISYVKALNLFFERFNLQQMEFRTPIINIAANRVKESLGMNSLGVMDLVEPYLLDGTQANKYILTKDELTMLLSK
jgi:RimJ/RimL family protein N-acetyltransferase